MAVTTTTKTDRDYITEELVDAVKVSVSAEDRENGWRGGIELDTPTVTIDDCGCDDIPRFVRTTTEVDGVEVELEFTLNLAKCDGSELVYDVEAK